MELQSSCCSQPSLRTEALSDADVDPADLAVWLRGSLSPSPTSSPRPPARKPRASPWPAREAGAHGALQANFSGLSRDPRGAQCPESSHPPRSPPPPTRHTAGEMASGQVGERPGAGMGTDARLGSGAPLGTSASSSVNQASEARGLETALLVLCSGSARLSTRGLSGGAGQRLRDQGLPCPTAPSRPPGRTGTARGRGGGSGTQGGPCSQRPQSAWHGEAMGEALRAGRGVVSGPGAPSAGSAHDTRSRGCQLGSRGRPDVTCLTLSAGPHLHAALLILRPSEQGC